MSHRIAVKAALFSVVICIASSIALTANAAGQDIQHKQLVTEAGHRPGSPEGVVTGPFFRIMLDTAGAQDSAVLESLDAMNLEYALKFAADAYAVSSGDYQVTVGKLLDAGYFPYDVFTPEQREIDLSAVQGGSLHPDSFFAQVGTPDWEVSVRSGILQRFFERFYLDSSKHGYLATAPQELPRAEAFWRTIDSGQAQLSSTPISHGSVMQVGLDTYNRLDWITRDASALPGAATADWLLPVLVDAPRLETVKAEAP